MMTNGYCRTLLHLQGGGVGGGEEEPAAGVYPQPGPPLILTRERLPEITLVSAERLSCTTHIYSTSCVLNVKLVPAHLEQTKIHTRVNILQLLLVYN